MKKALLLGAMAFLAINVFAQPGTVNVKTPVKKGVDELKMEKEKAALSTAKTVEAKDATATNATGKVATNEIDPKNMTRETRAAAAINQETTDKPKQSGRQRPTVVQPGNANASAVGKPVSPTPSTLKLSAPSAKKNVAPNSLKPVRPRDPSKESATTNERTDK